MSDVLFIEGGRVIDPASGVDGVRTVVIRDGKVAEVAERVERPRDARAVDARNRWVTPGFVDLHVHLREPGQEYKETVATGARAAVAGGFTAVCAMPNTKPVNDCAAVTELVLARAAAAGLARVYPVGAISRGSNGEELAEYGELKASGCVALSDDGRPVMSSALMRRALEYARAFGLPLTVHEEDLHLVGKGVMHEGAAATRLGLKGIPSQAEDVMVLRDIALVELTGGRLHVAHVSTAGAVRAIREAKRRGLPVTGEVTPHHLALTDDDVGASGYSTDFKMNPPLRSAEDVRACREALADGTLDAIATDHAPHSAVEKDVEFDAAANGIVGLETAFSVCLGLVREGALTERRLVEALTVGPARVFGLPAGTLARGAAADVAVLDAAAEWTVDPARLHSKGRNTPWKGRRLAGRCTHTIVGGRIVHEEDKADR
ncbi:dihydroorotase, multifunctional complex type [Anaeromyxobacter dehalogenans 2CP-1]|uniref:Dihydroorotase n=1 Tax=Anaeromyxobacter dehalogenans (strain ATCC BAA-258 / DSM 21875 / 2CP-1) TaxID=455488 RepID=PYRC_ANAD2|nr:dihydroorotase [Anaeromyxobacter dehalogenans]B8JAE8.1 RecName: Full=Dihydroorotase; Short=DHOase [Anaeromyxobacter dehalogenans 2CP-1]ACL65667.1 dihydroorotase, multifunctional complex type [Anaeromyxobacter dehalogenans 2CP-1]